MSFYALPCFSGRPICQLAHHRGCFLLIISVLLFHGTLQSGEGPRLIEVRDSVQAWSGRLLAKDDKYSWIMTETGGVWQLETAKLTGFRVIADEFRTVTPAKLYSKLRAEVPEEYEVAQSARFIVAAGSGRASTYAAYLERIYRDVVHFYQSHGVEVSEPTVPMAVLLFSDQYEFRAYCERDNTRWSDDLRGYYSLQTNRVALFDDRSTDWSSAETVEETASRQPAHLQGLTETAARSLSKVSPRTLDTLVHEVVHQIGYNTGVHSRFGRNPQWLVEGLAMHLETPDSRTRRGHSRSETATPINAERLAWFRDEYTSRQAAGDLAGLIASEDLFTSSPFDAYSLSWALTSFLGSENSGERRKQFADYLALLKTRDSMEPYSAEDRLLDFQQCFGDIALLEVELWRHVESLETAKGDILLYTANDRD